MASCLLFAFVLGGHGLVWPALAALNEFPFAEIKLDRQFVEGSSSARLKRSVCSQIVDMAKGHGIKTVAEGVETPEQLVLLRQFGCDQVQGYLISKPLPLSELARFLVFGRHQALLG